MPVAGTVIEVNPLLKDSLDALNNEPLSDGWLIKIEPADYNTDIFDLVEYSDLLNENS
jgi:glycine cleavage system H lipoate-binding protein